MTIRIIDRKTDIIVGVVSNIIEIKDIRKSRTYVNQLDVVTLEKAVVISTGEVIHKEFIRHYDHDLYKLRVE